MGVYIILAINSIVARLTIAMSINTHTFIGAIINTIPSL